MSDDRKSSPILLELYQKYLEHRDARLFADQVSQRYVSATLVRLAQAGDRYRRRAAVLALGLLADYEVNHVMGCALIDMDRGVRMHAENGIRAIWKRAGNDFQREQLEKILEMNAAKRFDQTIALATELVEQAPWFAEVWNQRALAFYHRQRYTESIRDCRQALEINPYHFGAATGMGQCHLKLGDRMAALDCFRRALRLNPNLERVRAQVIQLQKSLQDE